MFEPIEPAHPAGQPGVPADHLREAYGLARHPCPEQPEHTVAAGGEDA